MTKWCGDEGGGGRLSGSGEAQASQKREKGRTYEDNNSHKISRDRAAHERVKMKHGRGGQETSNGCTTPNGTGGPGLRSRPTGGVGSRTGGRRM